MQCSKSRHQKRQKLTKRKKAKNAKKIWETKNLQSSRRHIPTLCFHPVQIVASLLLTTKLQGLKMNNCESKIEQECIRSLWVGVRPKLIFFVFFFFCGWVSEQNYFFFFFLLNLSLGYAFKKILVWGGHPPTENGYIPAQF